MVDTSICGPWLHMPDSPGSGKRCPSSPLHPPQAVEAAQLAEDLKVQLEHVQTRLREIQPCLAESRAAREKESFNLKRAQVCGGQGWGRGGGRRFRLRTLALSLAPLLPQEDISRLRRKLEKQRKVEVYADADEILQEEIKEYKVGPWGWVVLQES